MSPSGRTTTPYVPHGDGHGSGRGVEPRYLATDAKATALVELEREIARLRALQLRILAVAGDVAEESGARSPGAWLDQQVKLGHAAGSRADRFAEALEVSWRQVGAALGAGRLTESQAEVIVRALDELPESAGRELRERAEAHLVMQAEHLDPRQLRRLGRAVLEVVAPEVVEAEEYLQLCAEEKRARNETRVSLRSLGDGTAELRARVPDHVAARLRVYLEAIVSPRRTGVSDSTHQTMGARRLGEGFCALLERMPQDGLPQHGATATTVMVLIDLEELRREVGVADLGTGDRLTASEVRRMACNASIVPAVLGPDSEVLDLGRSSRFFKAAQRKAMVVRDRRCREEGCSVPAAWCEAHHWGTPWSQGGRTDLSDGVLLCSWHHHRAHDKTYDARRMPNGDVRFTRRT